MEAITSVKCVGVSADGKTYFSGSDDNSVHLWTLPCGSPIPPGAVCVCTCVSVRY
jgi:WD40 repeat protein